MYAHNRIHDFYIKLVAQNEEEALQELLNIIPVHGWNYTEKEIRELLEEDDIYFSKSPIH